MWSINQMGSRAIVVLGLLAATVSALPGACRSFSVLTSLITTPVPSVTSEPTATQPSAARWIEVVLDEQRVLLHAGNETVGEYRVSTGVGLSPETTTYPGEYQVQSMWRGPEETAPGVFVKDIIVFDWEHGNGFHSLPMDKDGNILDPTLGKPATAGCIRLANSDELYRFAELGMTVIIH
jgi:lipoprotein-anchoring transpeptidase ErfK/SrfK